MTTYAPRYPWHPTEDDYRVNEQIKEKAISFLRANICEDDKAKIRSLIEQHGAEGWILHLYDEEIEKLTPEQRSRGLAGFYAARGHFGYGMRIRNGLRSVGCGEQEMGVENLDDVYVGLINEAVK